MEIFLNPETWIALATLTLMEIVLGIDNIIFISIVSNKLPVGHRTKTRNIGLAFALIFRIALLGGITYIIGFSKPLFTIQEIEFSIRDLILAGGGLFLIAKSTSEINHKMVGMAAEQEESSVDSVLGVVLQIIMLDIIFSFDSILTAVGLTKQLPIMIIAVIIAMVVMMLFSKSISDFIAKNPSVEILALSFLILIGFMLALEAVHHHVPKGYIYFAVFFSIVVEMINLRIRKMKRNPVKLNKKLEAIPETVKPVS